MKTPSSKVDSLDLSVFSGVPSQTSDAEKRGLLALQRAVANHFGTYEYLEIGSHLGGSLQPHVLDPRCTLIHSVDLRPQIAPDDRSKTFQKVFQDNSTARMLSNLRAVDAKGVEKIRTYDMDSKDVPRSAFERKVQLAFIDGEHTHAGALRDHALCRAVIADDGVILFHDMYIVFPAIMEIMGQLEKEGVRFQGMKLDRSLFALFFDPELANKDEHLQAVGKRESSELKRLILRLKIRRMIPTPLLALFGKG